MGGRLDFFYNSKCLEIEFCVQQDHSDLKTSERALKNPLTGRNISKMTPLLPQPKENQETSRIPIGFSNLYFPFYYVHTKINICNNTKRGKPLLKRESKIVKLWRKSEWTLVTKQKYFDYQVSKCRQNDKGSWRQKHLPLRNRHFSKDNIRVLGEEKEKKEIFTIRVLKKQSMC